MHGARLIGSAVAFVDPESGILFVRDIHRRDHWALPGGFCHRREMPSEAAEREVWEEVGLKVNLARSEPTVFYDFRYPHVHFLWMIVYDKREHGVPTRRSFETRGIAWHDLDGLPANVDHGTRLQLSRLMPEVRGLGGPQRPRAI